MKEEFYATIYDELVNVLTKYESKHIDKGNVEELTRDMAKLIQNQAKIYPQKDVVKALKLITHPDKISKYPNLQTFNQNCIDGSAGLFGVVQAAEVYQLLDEKEDWESFLEKLKEDLDLESTLDKLKEDYSEEKKSYAKKLLKAQISLIELIIKFQNNTSENLGEKYKEIIMLVPLSTTIAMASLAPYLTSFMLLNHVVQQMLYNNRVPQPGILKTLHRGFLMTSTIFSVPSNLLTVWTGYINVFLADYMLTFIKHTYTSFNGSLTSASDSRDLILYSPKHEANINLRMIFSLHEFTIISSLINGYIEKQQKAFFPSLWTGTSKAEIMRAYLFKLASLDRTAAEPIDKLKEALSLTVTELELNKTINGSGSEAMLVVGQVRDLLTESMLSYQNKDECDNSETPEDKDIPAFSPTI